MTFARGSVRVRGQPNLLGPLYLNDPRVVHHDLHDAKAKLLNLLCDDFQPVRSLLLAIGIEFRCHACQSMVKHY